MQTVGNVPQHKRPGRLWWLPLALSVGLFVVMTVGSATQGRHVVNPSVGDAIGGGVSFLLLVMLPVFLSGRWFERWRQSSAPPYRAWWEQATPEERTERDLRNRHPFFYWRLKRKSAEEQALALEAFRRRHNQPWGA